jgi:ribosomal protein S18 acetylase RimI-like enzyme
VTAMLTRPWLLVTPQFRSGVVDRVRLVLTGAIPARSDLTLPPPTMTLAAMAVVRASRRKRIGQRLLENFEKRAAEMGMRSLRLSTRSDNVAARRLYEGAGWRLLSDSGELVYYCRTL